MANISHFTQTVNGVSTSYDIHDANAIPRSGGAVITGDNLSRTVNNNLLKVCGGTENYKGGTVALYGKDSTPNLAGTVVLQPSLSSSSFYNFILYPDGTATWGSKNLAMQEDVIPRSGGPVITNTILGRSVDSSELAIFGGKAWNSGGGICVYGKDSSTRKGFVVLTAHNGTSSKQMFLEPDGTWTWNGTACQITSDQRYKQQIDAIDDKLLDAWEDVDLVQFKYNDAVEQKGDNARLHTGYVVQQIQKACESHGVDISQYGLFCHEEYPEETEEVEVEQKDGTKTKERKVIREASEHYSLRYTEALIVECKYLRKCIKELRNEIEELKSSK